MTLIQVISKLSMVSKVSAWNDRTYINLVGYDAGSHGDRTRKIWIKGDILTIERGKGVCSGRFGASFDDFIAALIAAGATTDKPFRECRTSTSYNLSALKMEG
jgi:hypothetical protein